MAIPAPRIVDANIARSPQMPGRKGSRRTDQGTTWAYINLTSYQGQMVEFKSEAECYIGVTLDTSTEPSIVTTSTNGTVIVEGVAMRTEAGERITMVVPSIDSTSGEAAVYLAVRAVSGTAEFELHVR